MQENQPSQSSSVSRRQFLRATGAAAGGTAVGVVLAGCATQKKQTAAAAAVVAVPAVVHAQNKMPINAIIIGLGGRGGDAGKNFLEAAKNVGVEAKVVAVADIFPDKATGGVKHFEVPADKCFSGFDGYQKALAVPGVNYAILATPPGFRAAHFKACIEAGKHVFTEKPVAVDGVGCQIMYAAAEEAKKKNLKVAAGTQRRHQKGYIETIKRIHDGAIGDIAELRAYWVNSGPIWHRGMKGDTDLERQIHNWYHYIWLCGDHVCEQHVHNIDVCNWIVKDHPVKAWGMGARQQLGNQPGEIWDNFAMEFEYANGVHMHSYCGQIKRDFSSVSEAVVGTKGTANPGGNIKPMQGEGWRFREKDVMNPYVQEHIDLINAIINDTPLNEGAQVTDSTLTAIMGREAAYSGSPVEWDDVLKSKFTYGPPELYTNPAAMTWGAFRTLKPPMPGTHDIFKDKVELPTV